MLLTWLQLFWAKKPDPSSLRKLRLRAINQRLSPLLRLPKEVRDKIYRYSLIPEYTRQYELHPTYHPDGIVRRGIDGGTYRHLLLGYHNQTRVLVHVRYHVSLLRVCRQINDETKAFLV